MRFTDQTKVRWIRKTVWVQWNPCELAALEVIPQEYERFRQVFRDEPGPTALPEYKEWDSEIPLEEGKNPPKNVYTNYPKENSWSLKIT